MTFQDGLPVELLVDAARFALGRTVLPNPHLTSEKGQSPVTAPATPFVPRVLRSDAGTVAVEVNPQAAPVAAGFAALWQLVALGPDGREFLTRHNLPPVPGAMLNPEFLFGTAPDILRWRELAIRQPRVRQP